MIHHVVMCALNADADRGELQNVMDGLAALVGRIDGFDGFDAGVNLDLESKTPDHGFGFICRFRDRAALDRYASDSAHAALGARLVALCQGGVDGVRV